jgi:hypothetical protein
MYNAGMIAAALLLASAMAYAAVRHLAPPQPDLLVGNWQPEPPVLGGPAVSGKRRGTGSRVEQNAGKAAAQCEA